MKHIVWRIERATQTLQQSVAPERGTLTTSKHCFDVWIMTLYAMYSMFRTSFVLYLWAGLFNWNWYALRVVYEPEGLVLLLSLSLIAPVFIIKCTIYISCSALSTTQAPHIHVHRNCGLVCRNHNLLAIFYNICCYPPPNRTLSTNWTAYVEHIVTMFV